MTNDFDKIQPLRYFLNSSEFINRNYYEKEHYNIAHNLVYAPENLFIPFGFNVPTLYTNIVSAKLYCPDETTEHFDFKAKLKNATDLKLISFTDSEGILQHRVEYRPSDGFFYGGAVVYIGIGPCIMKIVLNNPNTGKTATYRTDLIRIFDKDEAATGVLAATDLTLDPAYMA